MKELYKRLKAETPLFWRKVQKIMLKLGAVVTAVWQINDQMALNLPPNIITFCKYALVVCAAITITSQFTIKDSAKV
jgi:hypothetical protein